MLDDVESLVAEVKRLRAEFSDYQAAAEVEASLGDESRDEVSELIAENERLRDAIRKIKDEFIVPIGDFLDVACSMRDLASAALGEKP